MFAQPCRGRAWRGCPKPRRRSWLRKQSVQALCGDWNRSGLTGPFRLEGFAVADVFLLLVKLWSRGFGRETRRPPGWPGAQNGFASSASDRGPQRRTGAIEEALHPGTLASRVVIFANRFARRGLDSRCPRAALADAQIPALVAGLQFAIQS